MEVYKINLYICIVKQLKQNNMKEIYYTKSGNTFFVHYAYEKKDIFKQLAVVRNEQVAKLLVEAYKIEYQITK